MCNLYYYLYHTSDYFQVTTLLISKQCMVELKFLSFVHLKTGMGAPGFSCLPAFCATLNSDAKLAAGLLLS